MNIKFMKKALTLGVSFVLITGILGCSQNEISVLDENNIIEIAQIGYNNNLTEGDKYIFTEANPHKLKIIYESKNNIASIPNIPGYSVIDINDVTKENENGIVITPYKEVIYISVDDVIVKASYNSYTDKIEYWKFGKIQTSEKLKKIE